MKRKIILLLYVHTCVRELNMYTYGNRCIAMYADATAHILCSKNKIIFYTVYNKQFCQREKPLDRSNYNNFYQSFQLMTGRS